MKRNAEGYFPIKKGVYDSILPIDRSFIVGIHFMLSSSKR